MSFNIFGPTQKRDITVGYISTDRGYIQNVSILDANNYAFKNPGTTFIVQTRDGVKYFNINDVNNLKPDDIIPSNTAADGTCQGVVGLNPQTIGDAVAIGTGSPGNTSNLHNFLPRGPYAQLPDQDATGGDGSGGNGGGNGGDIPTGLGPAPTGIGTVGTGGPIVVISGCGGVGAAAVPIIGNDGGILDIVVTAGGFGYRCPPKVSVIDPNRRGSGVVATSVIGVTTSPTLITYDSEDDFEIYDFDPANGIPGLTGYGNRVGPNGEDLGDWDPSLYATFAQDPIGIEIARYQKFLRELKKPWWSTRKETPLNVAFGNKKDRVKHDVQHWEWDGDSKLKSGPNTQYKDVEFEVFTQGGNQADRGMMFKFVSEDGSHKFQFKAESYKDSRKTKVTKKIRVNTTYLITASGSFKGGGVEQGLVGNLGRNSKEIKGNNKKGSTIFADFVKSSNDNDDLQIRATQGRFTATGERKFEGHSTTDLEYRFDVKGPGIDKKIKPSFMNNYAISPVPASDVPGSDFAGRWCTFDWEEDFPYAGEYVFRGMADNIGKMYLDNELIMEAKHFRGDPLPSNVVKKTVEAGVHKIKVDLYNAPQKATVSTTVTNNTQDEKKKVPVNFEVYGQGSKRNTAINMVFTSEDGKHSFTFKPEELKGSKYDYKKTVRVFPNTQYKVQAVSTHKIKGNTPSRRSETKLPIVITGNSSTSGLEVNDSGKRIRYDDDATNGFDENAQLRIVSSSPGVNAKFSSDGTELLVKGSGDVTLKFSWDDNPSTSGLAVGKLTVGGQVFQQINEKGSQTKTVTVGSNVSGSRDQTVNLVPEQGTLKSNAFKKGKQKENATRSNVIFADIVGSANDNDDMQVRCSEGTFVPTNRRKITGTGPKGEQTRNTWDLTFTVNAKPSLKPKDSGTNVTEIFNTTDYIGKADRKLWRTNLYNNASFLNEYGICPFNTVTKKNEDYDGTHVIRWEHITFPADGNYQIEIQVDDKVKLFIGNRSGVGAMGIGNGLKNVDDGGDEVIIEKDGFVGSSNRSTGKSTYTRFFKKGQYRIRAELYQKPGGDFGFNGRKSYGQKDGSNISARFVNRDGKNYLKVDGSGTAEISFRLRVDDNPRISGVFASKVKIGRPPNDYVLLSRRRSGGRYKEKEIITGSDIFEAGREYPIETIGSSRGTGSIIKNNGRTIEYDDNIGNGFDENADLSIVKIKNKQGAPNKGLNPMALAIRIRADVIETTRISPRTWNQNPMGAAFTIDAPLPPIPISPKPISEGRCPDNPTWTTRFSGGNEKWWPVTHKFRDGSRSWSKFMNRFAISPIPPLGTINSDGGGIVYRNTWNIDILHAGFYALKGTVDNGGRILVDGTERMRGGYFPTATFSAPADVPQGRLAGFRETSPPMHKFYLDEGKHTITVEVENQKTLKQKKVEKKIFSTQDWRNNKVPQGRVPVDFDVYGQGSKSNKQINFVFTSEDGKDSFTFKPKETKGNYNYSRQVKVLPGMNYKVQAVATGKLNSGKQEYPLEFDGLNSANQGPVNSIEVSGKNSTNQNDTLKLRDGDGSDANAKFTIISTSPGVSAKFSDDGKKLLTNGNGDVTIRLKWDDNPRTAGVAVKSIKIGGKTWRQSGQKGEQDQTLSTTKGSTDLVPEQGTLKRGSFGKSKDKGAKESSNGSDVIFADIIGSLNDNDDIQVRASVGEFTPSNKRKGVQGTSGQGTQKRNTWDLTFKVEGDNPTQVKAQGSVTYSGPRLFVIKSGSAVRLWSKFMQRNAVSPFIPPIDLDSENHLGDRTYIWKDVNFFESGQYKFLFQSDDGAILYINGNKVAESKSDFRGEASPTYTELSSGKYEVKVVCNNVRLNRNVLTGNNPTGFALKIMKDVVISEKSLPWTTNPVGISAMLIPPPCPKVVIGKGIVTDIIVRDPGNGNGPETSIGTPTIVTVKDVEPTLPGINYDPNDIALINDIPVTIDVDNFGRIIKINVPTGGSGTGSGTSGTAIRVTDTPVIDVPSLTGVGFRGTPIMQTTVVPEEVFAPEDIIQVTDLVGLTQNGYVNGKPYYGSVFSRDGRLFAGIYETTGELVPVYATLQESIANRVTTRPSAILRQGTSANSNNPNLNIPGTPQNLI